MDDSGAAGSHRRKSDASGSYFPEGAEAVREDAAGPREDGVAVWKDGVACEDSGLTVRAYGETFPDAAQAWNGQHRRPLP